MHARCCGCVGHVAADVAACVWMYSRVPALMCLYGRGLTCVTGVCLWCHVCGLARRIDNACEFPALVTLTAPGDNTAQRVGRAQKAFHPSVATSQHLPGHPGGDARAAHDLNLAACEPAPVAATPGRCLSGPQWHSIDLVGAVLKRNSQQEVWRRVWFVLRGPMLFMFKKRPTPGSAVMRSMAQVDLADDEDGGTQYGLGNGTGGSRRNQGGSGADSGSSNTQGAEWLAGGTCVDLSLMQVCVPPPQVLDSMPTPSPYVLALYPDTGEDMDMGDDMTGSDTNSDHHHHHDSRSSEGAGVAAASPAASTGDHTGTALGGVRVMSSSSHTMVPRSVIRAQRLRRNRKLRAKRMLRTIEVCVADVHAWTKWYDALHRVSARGRREQLEALARRGNGGTGLMSTLGVAGKIPEGAVTGGGDSDDDNYSSGSSTDHSSLAGRSVSGGRVLGRRRADGNSRTALGLYMGPYVLAAVWKCLLDASAHSVCMCGCVCVWLHVSVCVRVSQVHDAAGCHSTVHGGGAASVCACHAVRARVDHPRCSTRLDSQ